MQLATGAGRRRHLASIEQDLSPLLRDVEAADTPALREARPPPADAVAVGDVTYQVTFHPLLPDEEGSRPLGLSPAEE